MTTTQALALAAFGAALLVAADAAHLGARRGALGGGFLDMGPIGWSFCVLIVPVIGLICYLAHRPVLTSHLRTQRQLAANRANLDAFRQSAVSQHVPGMPPGWYVDPESGVARRWWDGLAWTDKVTWSAPPGR